MGLPVREAERGALPLSAAILAAGGENGLLSASAKLSAASGESFGGGGGGSILGAVLSKDLRPVSLFEPWEKRFAKALELREIRVRITRAMIESRSPNPKR